MHLFPWGGGVRVCACVFVLKTVSSPGWVTQLIGGGPVHEKVAGLIPGQSAYQRQLISLSPVSLSPPLFCLPLSLSLSQISKHILR